MTDTDLYQPLLDALTRLGGSAGNKTLRESLAWDEGTYDRVVAQLKALGKVVPGRGRGGSLSLPGFDGAEAPELAPTATPEEADRFVAVLTALGGNAGNVTLQERLGWDKDTYFRVQKVLVQTGKIATGRGRGGSVQLTGARTAPGLFDAMDPLGSPPSVPAPMRETAHPPAPTSEPMAPLPTSTEHHSLLAPVHETARASPPVAPPPSAPSPARPQFQARSGSAIKKTDLYSSLWASCDELRGGMDASQYKDYVLVLLFIKYISDKYAGQEYAPITIPPGSSFADMVALKGKPDIGDQINKKILAPLAQENKLSDLPDFNDQTKLGTGKELVERLTNLIAIFENPALDFSRNRADGDDILGDAYEYLMRHFATESGKSKGQFYTPAEVSLVMARILRIRDIQPTRSTTIYDPTCGSGSLLLKASHEAGTAVTLYGQEKDAATTSLARMNMILHDNPTASITQGNTLTTPKYTDQDTLKTFDFVVANPPFSDKRWSTGLDPAQDPFERFQPYGIPPPKQGDYAYLLHIVRSLKSTGRGACILPHGVLFRGNAEAVIRKNLIQRGLIQGIIGLPANLFYGTGIPACIIVIDKRDAIARKGIFMIDASKGFKKDGPKNRLRDQDIHKIVDTFTRQIEIPRYARLVPVSEIADPKNDYNLNLPRYIDTTEPEDLQDIDAHLRGGIPNRDLDALAPYWCVIPQVREALFQGADRPGYAQLRLPIGEVKAAILNHTEFVRFQGSVHEVFDRWKGEMLPILQGFGRDAHPKHLIERVSETLLQAFETVPLLDAYDLYQHLMDFWSETMQDDAYLIAAEGWVDAAQPALIVEDRNKKSKARPDLVLGKRKYLAELVPPRLIIQRWFASEQATIDQLEADMAALGQQIEELVEEHSGEEGLLAEAANDKGKVTRASATARLREIRGEADAAEEIQTLKDYLALVEKESALSERLDAAREAMMNRAASRYGSLTEPEVKQLVIEDKWLGALETALKAELDRISQSLTGRIRQLAERYATRLPQLINEVEALAAKVDAHLKKMGASWK